MAASLPKPLFLIPLIILRRPMLKRANSKVHIEQKQIECLKYSNEIDYEIF